MGSPVEPRRSDVVVAPCQSIRAGAPENTLRVGLKLDDHSTHVDLLTTSKLKTRAILPFPTSTFLLTSSEFLLPSSDFCFFCRDFPYISYFYSYLTLLKSCLLYKY